MYMWCSPYNCASACITFIHCKFACFIYTGKRSIKESVMDEDASDSFAQLPFSTHDHTVHRKKRQCTRAATRYVLFILDTSGSIGLSNFNAVKKIIAAISSKFCDHLKMALITYSNEINLEFCFNCYGHRQDIYNATMNTQYRGGTTHTHDAVKCACQTMLSAACGIPKGINQENIDVVILTDGKHNGPCKSQLKSAIGCLHGRSNINTFGIGIGTVNADAVNALVDVHDETHIFRVASFEQLKQLLTILELELAAVNAETGKKTYTCAGHAGLC